MIKTRVTRARESRAARTSTLLGHAVSGFESVTSVNLDHNRQNNDKKDLSSTSFRVI